MKTVKNAKAGVRIAIEDTPVKGFHPATITRDNGASWPAGITPEMYGDEEAIEDFLGTFAVAAPVIAEAMEAEDDGNDGE